MSTAEPELLQPEAPEVTKKSRAIAKRNGTPAVEVVPHQPSMEEVLMRAVEQGASIETLERIEAMLERAHAAAAKREYFAALSLFQGQMPSIKKPKKVKNRDESVRFWYAPLDYILALIRPPLAANQLSLTTGCRIEGEKLIGTATCHHVGGHSETREFPVPITLSQFMSDQQSYAAASHFAERNAVMQVLAITPEGEDNESRITPREARERQPVPQPRETPTAQKAAAQKANGNTKKVDLEPAGEGEAIDANTVRGLTHAMEHAGLGQSDFQTRFPKLSGLEQVPRAGTKAVLSWIADPTKN